MGLDGDGWASLGVVTMTMLGTRPTQSVSSAARGSLGGRYSRDLVLP